MEQFKTKYIKYNGHKKSVIPAMAAADKYCYLSFLGAETLNNNNRYLLIVKEIPNGFNNNIMSGIRYFHFEIPPEDVRVSLGTIGSKPMFHITIRFKKKFLEELSSSFFEGEHLSCYGSSTSDGNSIGKNSVLDIGYLGQGLIPRLKSNDNFVFKSPFRLLLEMRDYYEFDAIFHWYNPELLPGDRTGTTACTIKYLLDNTFGGVGDKIIQD